MSLWSPQQREWLRALGHPALVLGARPADAPAERQASAEPAVAADDGDDAAPAPAPAPAPSRRVAPASPVAAMAAAAAPPQPARTGAAAKAAALAEARRAAALAAGRYDGLREQVLRAATRAGTGAAPSLAALDVDLPRLHADPAAKRALWRRIRELRRRAP